MIWLGIAIGVIGTLFIEAVLGIVVYVRFTRSEDWEEAGD